MLELIETLVSTTSFFEVFRRLAEMNATEMMVLFLLSKPLFVIIALGAVFSGRSWGEAHYLHHQQCDRFLTNTFSSSQSPEERR